MASTTTESVAQLELSKSTPSPPGPMIQVTPAPAMDPPALPGTKDSKFLAPPKPPRRKKSSKPGKKPKAIAQSRGALDRRPPVYDGRWIHPNHPSGRLLQSEVIPSSEPARPHRKPAYLRWSAKGPFLPKGQRLWESIREDGTSLEEFYKEARRKRDEASGIGHGNATESSFEFFKEAKRKREEASRTGQVDTGEPRLKRIRHALMRARLESCKECWRLMDRLLGAKAYQPKLSMPVSKA